MAPLTTLTFTVTTYTPFRVATGSAGAGADAVVDRQVPIPAGTIKGLMRDAARSLLGRREPDHPLILEVFGAEQSPGGDAGSPWHWEDVALPGEALDVRPRTRVRIDPDTRVVVPEALMVGEEVAATSGSIEVWASGPIAVTRLDLHQALLLLSAALVEGLGSDRRAGNGWVRLAPRDATDGPEDWADRVRLLSAERAPAGHGGTPSSAFRESL